MYMYVHAYVSMYICAHGEMRNANGCWSATCSCLSATQVMHAHTYSHVHAVYQQNYVLETKNGKTHQIHIHMYMYVCSYVYVVCFPHFPVQHLQKYVCHISQIMYAMKNAFEECKDHAVEIHAFAMNVCIVEPS